MAANVIELIVKAVDQASQTLQNIGREGQKAASLHQKAWEAAKPAIAAGLGAFVTQVGLAIKAAGDFEAGMREVNSMLGLSEAEFQELSRQTLQVAKNLGVDAVGATKALYQAISAGVPKENAMTFLEVASKAAIAGVTSTEVAVDGLTTVLNAFGMKASEVQHVADVMFTTVKLGKTNFEQLAASIYNVAPLAASAGVKFEEVAAALATLTKQGVPTSVATTQIRAAIQAIIKPSAEAKKVADSLGLAFNEQALRAQGLHGFLQKVYEATGGNKEQMAALFGSVEALNAVLALTGPNLQMAKSDLEAMASASQGAGAATEAFNEINKGFNRQMEELVNRVKAAAIEFGQNWLPTLGPLIGGIGQLTAGLGPLIPVLTSAATGVGTFAAKMGKELWPEIQKLLGSGPLFTKLGGTVVGAFGTMKGAAGAFFTFMLTNPIGLAIAGIVAAVALLALAWKNNWFDIQGKTRAAVDTIKRLIGGVVDFVKRLPSEMLAWGRRMIEALAQGIRNAIGSVLNGAVDAVRSVLNRLNPFARHSPSLVEQVWAGVKEIGRAYESLKGLSLPAPQLAGAGAAAQAAASGPLVINGPLVQVGSLQVRSEEDIRRVSQELYGLVRQALRGRGVR